MNREREVSSAPRSKVGILLQGIAFFLVWAIRGERSIAAGAVPTATVIVAAVLALGSLMLIVLSIRHLGRQWAFRARTIEGHQLITRGPYGIVRHPIYLGMGGFLVSVGLALAPWWTLVAAGVLYVVGTRIRTNAEDALMAAAFGDAFDEYRRRVPSLFPGVR